MYSLLDQRPWRIFFLTLILLIPLLVYFKVQNFDFINWDDDIHVYENSSIRSITPAHLAAWFHKPVVSMYVPLPMLTYALDYRLYGAKASGYHRTNLILHLINVLLVFVLLNRFFADPWLTAAGALIFALHPIQVETVAWISERKNLLLTFFFLSGFLLWLRVKNASPRLQPVYRMAAICLFAAALGSKITAVVIPVIILGYEHCWEAKLNMRRFLIYSMLFVPALAVAVVSLKLYPQSVTVFFKSDYLSLILTEIADFCAYLKHIVYPVRLQLVYPKENYPFGQGADALGWLCLYSILIAGLVQALIKRSRYGFWLIWFMAFLAPVTTLFRVPVGDRHVYPALIGFIGLILFLFEKKELILLPILISANIVLAAMTFLQLDVWRDSETAWQHVLRHQPQNLQAAMKLAFYCETHGETDKAAALYEKMLDEHRRDVPYPYLNLYTLYRRLGRSKDAERVRDRFHADYPQAPDMETVFKNIIARRNNPEEASRYVRENVHWENPNARK